MYAASPTIKEPRSKQSNTISQDVWSIAAWSKDSLGAATEEKENLINHIELENSIHGNNNGPSSKWKGWCHWPL